LSAGSTSLWAAYRQPRLFAVLAMGFASGLPLALTGATLGVRLTEAHVSLAAIGYYALVGLAYNFKVLWAPLLDRVPVPGLTRLIGRRRSWLIVLAVALMAAIYGLGATDPEAAPGAAVVWAVVVAFLSASQDVVIDAYRVEILHDAEQGAGAAATQLGYRLGMIASGAGALYAATAWGWAGAYAVMAGLMLIGVATALVAPEPEASRIAATLRPRFADAVVAPFRDFALRRGWWLLLIFIVLYRLGDAMSGHMASPFYIELGFSKVEIANVSKVLGVVAAMVGVALGGVVVFRLGVLRSLALCAVLQIVSNLLYVVQASAGHSVPVLALTIGLENLIGGMGSAAFVAYLSGLCSPAYTATQYALLSALALIGRNLCAATGGVLVQHLGWSGFFTLAALLVLPGLLLLVWLMRRPALGRPPLPA
jgi:PAT family beta-lactamase induction signal transducer AmpG